MADQHAADPFAPGTRVGRIIAGRISIRVIGKRYKNGNVVLENDPYRQQYRTEKAFSLTEPGKINRYTIRECGEYGRETWVVLTPEVEADMQAELDSRRRFVRAFDVARKVQSAIDRNRDGVTKEHIATLERIAAEISGQSEAGE